MNKSQIKAARIAFREGVFERDKHKCCFCDRTDDLDAHHITDRHAIVNGGYVLANGITLCPHHHELAELWHSSGHTQWAPGMHPDDLYARIKSSWTKAVVDSTKLGK